MTGKRNPIQRVTFALLRPTDSLTALLDLRVPSPYAQDDESFPQVQYIQNHLLNYLRDADPTADPACTVVVEHHYIDHHYMADYAAFYSRSLEGLGNSCRRVHFFRGQPDEVERELRRLRRLAAGPTIEYRANYRSYSQHAYLGFATIKPLPGTPVGTTVLRPYEAITQDPQRPTHRRFWPVQRPYRVHLLGVELRVEGLSFQQQDVGVSACATTAIWSSLQRARYHEEMPQTTPAMITTHATAASARGRAMPSEGLSLEQMAAAVSAFGLSPIIAAAQGAPAHVIRAVIHSALLSGQAPILLLQHAILGYHAATAVGYFSSADTAHGDAALEAWAVEAMGVAGLYVHDDRHGPYVRMDFEHGSKVPAPVGLRLMPRRDEIGSPPIPREEEHWTVKAVLTPTHRKVRLSFPELYKLLEGDLLTAVQAGWAVIGAHHAAPVVVARVYTRRNYEYCMQLLQHDRVDESLVELLTSTVALSRYVAVARLLLRPTETFIDILVDSTCTATSPLIIAVLTNARPDTRESDLATTVASLVGLTPLQASAEAGLGEAASPGHEGLIARLDDDEDDGCALGEEE